MGPNTSLSGNANAVWRDDQRSAGAKGMKARSWTSQNHLIAARGRVWCG